MWMPSTEVLFVALLLQFMKSWFTSQ